MHFCMGVLVWNNLVKPLSWGRLSSYLVTVVARCEYNQFDGLLFGP